MKTNKLSMKVGDIMFRCQDGDGTTRFANNEVILQHKTLTWKF